jgi:hypothetical protein
VSTTLASLSLALTNCRSVEGLLVTHTHTHTHARTHDTHRYPLDVKATSVDTVEVEFNPVFIARMLPRIDYKALRHTAGQLGMAGEQHIALHYITPHYATPRPPLHTAPHTSPHLAT